jgi:hypothetical protein
MIVRISILDGNIIPEIIPIHVSSWQAYKLEGKSREKVIEDVKEYSKIFKKSIFN